jgi:hypothetical protein
VEARQLILVAMSLGACGPSERTQGTAIPPATSVALSPDSAATCAVALGARARLQGTVRQRVYDGRANARDTVWLIETPAPLPPCNAIDTTSDSARRLVQLVPPPPAIMVLRDRVGLVVGRMGRATLPSHHTPYILFADSVLDPARMRGPARRAP